MWRHSHISLKRHMVLVHVNSALKKKRRMDTHEEHGGRDLDLRLRTENGDEV